MQVFHCVQARLGGFFPFGNKVLGVEVVMRGVLMEVVRC